MENAIKQTRIWSFWAWILIVIGILVIVIFMSRPPFNDGSGNCDASLFGQYGDFIGGFVGSIFSLAGFVMLYLTLKSQQLAIKKQDYEARMESFETTVFNLLNSQQHITNDIQANFVKLIGTSDIKVITIQGREFFRFAVTERNRINKCLKSKIYDGYYSDKDDEYIENLIAEIYDRSSPSFDPCNNPEEKENEIIQKRRRQLLNKIYGITQEHWDKAHKLQEAERVKYIYDIFFKRYHYAMGHYFRNLYHILKFIDQFESAQKRQASGYNEKSEINYKCFQYAQFVQAQMSAYELALLHDNALCFENMDRLVKKYNILENCAKEYLIDHINYVS
ncbi:putative phage abortive infection protein [Rikenella microfusus]|uniref:Phage abortive infection protein n=1 Tax=Rikenella microfusus TaxID=28139 RepID=A0A379MRK4_9BACT|nr:putative phage abortive infection protein [Rikenella microfusus]SUE34153.1 Uncharacterised protein [Rikenella microfusus]